ncbi:MAG: hypothetical protein ACE5HY_00505 [Candidatus Hydrothermarchaeales archaeon]
MKRVCRLPIVFIFLSLLVILSGCIEAGEVRPSEETKLPIPTLKPKETQGPPPSILAFSIPDQELPNEWIKTREVSESSGGLSRLTQTISPRTLYTTVVTWETFRDPYKTKFKEISKENSETITLTAEDGEEISAITIEEEGLYKIATHLGLYTFVASTSTPENIDNLEKFGTHSEVVNDIFLTGINLARRYDLETL